MHSTPLKFPARSSRTLFPIGNRFDFNLDNYVGRITAKKEETIIAKKKAAPTVRDQKEAKSYYSPPDEEEPQEIQDMEERFQQAVELNKKQFGTPVFSHNPGLRSLAYDSNNNDGVWSMMAQARPLDITHIVDRSTVEMLFEEIRNVPPTLPQDTSVLEEAIDEPCVVKK